MRRLGKLARVEMLVFLKEISTLCHISFQWEGKKSSPKPRRIQAFCCLALAVVLVRYFQDLKKFYPTPILRRLCKFCPLARAETELSTLCHMSSQFIKGRWSQAVCCWTRFQALSLRLLLSIVYPKLLGNLVESFLAALYIVNGYFSSPKLTAVNAIKSILPF